MESIVIKGNTLQHNGLTILNEFNHKMFKSQQKWLDEFIRRYPQDKIISVSLTRGGYICVDYKRNSKEYPFGREIRGVRAGWISSLSGKGYDFELGCILNGIGSDSLYGTKKFTME